MLPSNKLNPMNDYARIRKSFLRGYEMENYEEIIDALKAGKKLGSSHYSIKYVYLVTAN
jgi:hypothetical protein